MRVQTAFSSEGWIRSYTTGPDSVCIDALLHLHAPNSDPYILDVTFGYGRIWEHSAYRPDLTMDKRDLPGVGLVGDFTAMPEIADASIDVLVFDPPHLPTAAASARSSRMWEDRYGIDADDPLRAGDSVTGLFVPFLYQARRVLRDNGIVLARIADIVHNHRQQWQMCEFINLAAMCKLTPCDMMIRVDPKRANLKSGLWVNQKHLRHAHVYWIVVRKGGCERP